MKEKQGLFLDVESSLSGKSWIKPSEKEQRLATSLQQVTFLPYPLSILLAQKKINPEQIESFLNPKIKDTLPDPFSLHDMAEAVKILAEATLKKNKISIDIDRHGIVASLLYASRTSRPDISSAIGVLCQHVSKWSCATVPRT